MTGCDTYLLVFSEEHEVLGQLKLDEPAEEILLHLGVKHVDDKACLGELCLVDRAVL